MANNNVPKSNAKRLTILDKDIAINLTHLSVEGLYEIKAVISPKGQNQWTYLTAGAINESSKDVSSEFELVKEIINKALVKIFGKDNGDVPKTVLEQIEALVNALEVSGNTIK